VLRFHIAGKAFSKKSLVARGVFENSKLVELEEVSWVEEVNGGGCFSGSGEKKPVSVSRSLCRTCRRGLYLSVLTIINLGGRTRVGREVGRGRVGWGGGNQQLKKKQGEGHLRRKRVRGIGNNHKPIM